jgi:hypothetical protein
MGVEFLAFTIRPSGESSLSAENLRAIKPWIEGVKWMGEFTGSDPELFRKLREEFITEAWLFKNNLLNDEVSESEIWTTFQPVKTTDLLPEGNLQLQLENFSHAEQIHLLEKAFQEKRQVMLGNFYSPQEAMTLYSRFPELVFCLQSGSEERPGWMDLSGLQDYLEAISPV